MTRVAVIMSVYMQDDLAYLSESLESLYVQNFRDFDIFIQCDGPLKKDMMIFLEQQLKHGKISYLGRRKTNLGLARSLNDLLNKVTSLDYKLIMRMDADDICNIERMSYQVEFLERNPEIDVVGTDIIEFFDDGTKKEVNYPTSHEKILRNFAYRTALPHVTAMFRKSFFDKAGFYNVNSNRNEDQWLWLHGFKQNCKFACIDMPLVSVRLSKKLLGRRVDFKHNFDTLSLRNKIIIQLKLPKYFLIYNFFAFLIKLMPPALLQFIYKFR